MSATTTPGRAGKIVPLPRNPSPTSMAVHRHGRAVGAAQDLGVRRQADLAPHRVAIGHLHEGDLADVARDRGDGTAEPLRAARSVGRQRRGGPTITWVATRSACGGGGSPRPGPRRPTRSAAQSRGAPSPADDLGVGGQRDEELTRWAGAVGDEQRAVGAAFSEVDAAGDVELPHRARPDAVGLRRRRCRSRCSPAPVDRSGGSPATAVRARRRVTALPRLQRDGTGELAGEREGAVGGGHRRHRRRFWRRSRGSGTAAPRRGVDG